MEKLMESGLADTIKELSEEKPLLGICLGMQLLFDKSFEHGEHEGLGLIPGTVAPLAADIGPELKVPHMGRLDGKMDFLCEDVFDLLTRLAERK